MTDGGGIMVEESKNMMTVNNGRCCVTVDLESGLSAYSWKGGQYIQGAYSAVKISNEILRTTDYAEHRLQGRRSAHDGFGRGLHWTVVHRAGHLPTFKQMYSLYEGMPYFFIQAEVEGTEEWMCNYIAPIRTESDTASVVGLGGQQDSGLCSLFVPFDNDKWVRYRSVTVPSELESYEVTAVYDPQSRHGLVLGSVTHDLWKTGIKMTGNRETGIGHLEVYGGAVGEYTRDTIPHGMVAGTTIASPQIFVGYDDDYRRGLEAYGKANATIAPPLNWEGGTPFGWNSWSAVGGKMDYEVYTGTSDFLKQLQNDGFHHDGVVYINFDSFWNNLTEEQLDDAVKHVWNNGQKAGIYWTPFSFWGKDFGQKVEGTADKYTYGDLLLRDEGGNVLPELDGGLAIDPTHPGNIERVEWQMERFVKMGFEYIKLDFLGHGSLEGKHYHSDIKTGIQAYNFGMAHINNQLDPKRIDRPFFINLSISPLFPHQYAHSRRISCDAFGTLADTEYMLNSLTYGWWMNHTVYRFNDPDHTVLYKSYNQESTALHEGRSRLHASVIAGTVLLLGDDFRHEEARNRAKRWLADSEIIDLARKGRSFVPLEGNTGEHAANVFVLQEPAEVSGSTIYLAVFNYNLNQSATTIIPLKRLGLLPNQSYRLRDLCTRADWVQQGEVEMHLERAESRILRLDVF